MIGRLVAGGVQQEEQACRSPGSVTVQRVGSAGSHLRQSARVGGPGSTGSPTALVSTDTSCGGIARNSFSLNIYKLYG